ncbi:MAG: xanthine dehydrogenase family protein molybdopterin-binding subunit, partial [Gemmatimonadaceae bacterium]
MSTPAAAGKGAGVQRFVSTVVEVEGRSETKIVEMPDFEPAPWDESATLTIVGQRVPRVDAREKVTGRARFTTDIQRPGMLHAAIVRATIASGRVTAIDPSGALQLTGVLDVISSADLPHPIKAGGAPLFLPAVSYAGQPIAAVCAESREAALAGAAAVRLTYEAAPFVLTFEQATAPGAPVVRGTSNVRRGSPVEVTRGDAARGLADAHVVITREYRTPCVLHTPLEPHSAVAEWEDDRLTIWESTQGIFMVRDQVAMELRLAKSKVRVIKDYMGGGFGAKNHAGPHTFIAALFARRTGHPVRCVLERDEEQTDAGNRPSTRQVVTLGATRDGRLTVIDATCEVPLGAGGWEGGPAAFYREMYSCPNVRTVETFVHVNTPAMMAFRAPGHVEGAFALERAMDVLAGALGMDPLALRLVNFSERDEEKQREYSSNRLRQCYDEGAARFGWADREARRQGATAPHIRRGFGLAAQVWGAGGGPPAYATVRLNSDATVDVLSGTQDLGTGARTVLAQIAAEALGARLADVRVILGDTERTPYAGNSWGSMTTASVGPAVRSGAMEAQQRLLQAASQMMECHPEDLVAHDSIISTRDNARQMSFAEVTTKLGNVMIMGHGSRGPNPENVGLMSFGVQFAEVEVDV